MISPDSQVIVEAIKQVESEGGVNCGQGESGEYGCYQYMSDTWERYSKDVLGYVPEQTKINEEYVTVKKVSEWVRDGLSIEEIALVWNQGNTGECDSGVNMNGVRYDSCKYKERVLKLVSGM